MLVLKTPMPDRPARPPANQLVLVTGLQAAARAYSGGQATAAPHSRQGVGLSPGRACCRQPPAHFPSPSAKVAYKRVHKAAGAMAAHQAQTKAVAFMDKVKFFAEGHLKVRVALQISGAVSSKVCKHG